MLYIMYVQKTSENGQNRPIVIRNLLLLGFQYFFLTFSKHMFIIGLILYDFWFGPDKETDIKISK